MDFEEASSDQNSLIAGAAGDDSELQEARDLELSVVGDGETENHDPYRQERLGLVREVGSQAVWSLSTCKPGFGVENLRDNSLDSYWQSDGPQPHFINIQFKRRTVVSHLYIYTDFKQDESYTPFRVAIRAGSNFHDLRDVDCRDISEPSGWIRFALNDAVGGKCDASAPLAAHLVQLVVLSNHQNGRDSHLRQVRVHAPLQRTCVTAVPGAACFVSRACAQFAYIR